MKRTSDASHSPTVLIVDSEQSFRSLGAFLLLNEGYRVLTAATAEEAEELVGRYPLAVDLLLVDVDLPPSGGLWLAARFLARWPGLEILYSFREVQDDPVGRGLLPPETPLLFKPYGLVGISDTVRGLLKGTEAATFDHLGV